jgi:hypothetical protein
MRKYPEVSGMDFTDLNDKAREAELERGSREELDRLMRLFILTAPWIEKNVDERVCLFAAMEGNKPYLEDRRAYCSKRLKNVAGIALSENHPARLDLGVLRRCVFPKVRL